jgi:hypothetical protein
MTLDIIKALDHPDPYFDKFTPAGFIEDIIGAELTITCENRSNPLNC